MKIKGFIPLILLFTIFSMPALADFPSSEELQSRYPDISDIEGKPENKNVMCPFLRMLERSGALDTYKLAKKSEVMVRIDHLVSKTKEFGCRFFGCGAVASAVSVGQNTYLEDIKAGIAKAGFVNLTNLTHARGVAHECGLTFEKGGKVISDAVRSKTLGRLKEIADSNEKPGLLSEEDLMQVKLEICKEQGVKATLAGKVEIGLIYQYLGGKDRGFIEYSDVVRLLHATMPMTKSIGGL